MHWDYSVDGGDKLGGALSASLDGYGHMQHGSDHVLDMGDGEDHGHVSTGYHKGGTDDDHSPLEYAQGQVPCANYGAVLGDDHSLTNTEHDHISSGDCRGNIQSGHHQVGLGYGQVIIGNYGNELGSGHSHKGYELDHVLSGEHGAKLEGILGNGNVLSGNYGKNIGGVQNHIETLNNHILNIDYGGKTGSVQSNEHADVSSGDYGGNLEGGHNHINNYDAYVSMGGFEGEKMVGHDHMGHGHRGKGYEVYESVGEAQPLGHQNHRVNSNGSTDTLYVRYVGPETATDLGNRYVGFGNDYELDTTKHQHLHTDGSVVRNTYGGEVRDIWYNSHNSMEKDHTSSENSFANNHVDQQNGVGSFSAANSL
jgi:hypothetical protein